MSYATLAELKAALRITDSVDDALLQLALDASDELIDRHCGRTFVVPAGATTRTFDVDGAGTRVDVDDIYTTAGLVVATGTGTVIPAEVYGTSSGYRLGPSWAAQAGEPWTYLTYSGSWGGWPVWGSWWGTQINVTARWGYAATVPDAIRQAGLLQASRIFSRRQSPYGVAGSPELGSEVRLLAKVDPDVAVLLSPFVKMVTV